MKLRKNKSEPEQGRESRRIPRRGAANPAFSYYTTRTSLNVAEGKRKQRKEASEPAPKPLARPWRAQLPFWLFVLVGLVCVLKVLTLSTNPKVILLGDNAVTATYQQEPGAYASAAHELLDNSITNRSKLTVNTTGTVTALERQFPELQTVSLTVPLISSRPILYVQVAQPSVVLRTTHGNYALNKSGIVLAKLKSLPKDVPQVVDQSGAIVTPGKQFLPSSTIAFIQTLDYQFQTAKQPIDAFVLSTQSAYELDARLEGQSYSIRMNLQADPLVQSGAAIAALQNIGGTGPKEYIDVRLPGRVYYR